MYCKFIIFLLAIYINYKKGIVFNRKKLKINIMSDAILKSSDAHHSVVLFPHLSIAQGMLLYIRVGKFFRFDITVCGCCKM